MGHTIRITTQTTYTRVYEVDVDAMAADEYFEDTDITSAEAIAERLEDWLTDEPEEWRAPWARELAGLGEGDREVYEVDLYPEIREAEGCPADTPIASCVPRCGDAMCEAIAVAGGSAEGKEERP